MMNDNNPLVVPQAGESVNHPLSNKLTSSSIKSFLNFFSLCLALITISVVYHFVYTLPKKESSLLEIKGKELIMKETFEKQKLKIEREKANRLIKIEQEKADAENSKAILEREKWEEATDEISHISSMRSACMTDCGSNYSSTWKLRCKTFGTNDKNEPYHKNDCLLPGSMADELSDENKNCEKHCLIKYPMPSSN